MQRIRIVFIGACLCAFSSCIAAASRLQLRPDPHIVGSSPVNDPLQPSILKVDLTNKGVYARSCYAAHFSTQDSFIYWIIPAECVDGAKYDMVQVKYGYKDKSKAAFYLKDLYIETHLSYNNVTKAHNIAFVGLPEHINLEVENGHKKLQLPSATDNFDDKTLELYEYKDITTDKADSRENGILYSIKTKSISSVWCNILYPLSPIKNYRICLSGLLGKGLSKNDLGVPLIARDGDSFKLVGLATIVRPWTHNVSFPIEILEMQSYVKWIKSISGEK